MSRRTMTCALALLLSSPVSALAAEAGTPTWTPVAGLEAYAFSAVATDPADGSVVFAAAGKLGCNAADKVPGCDIYKSSDGGLSWTAVTASVPRIDVRALAVNGSTVYAVSRDVGAGERVLKSADGGTSWSEVAKGDDTGEQNKALLIDPFAATTVYAADLSLPGKTLNESFVIKSTNGGSFSHLPEISGGEIRAYAFAADPVTAGTIYAAGTGSPDIVKSVNAGATWQDIGLPASGLVFSLAIDPQAPARLYAGTDTDVHRTDDAGGSWVQKSTGLPGQRVTSIVIDPLDTEVLYAATFDRVWQSSNGAESWSEFGSGLEAVDGYVYALTLTPARRLIAATPKGLYTLSLEPETADGGTDGGLDAGVGGGAGSSGNGGSGGASGSGATGGSPAAGGTTSSSQSDDDGGCGCRTAPRDPTSHALWLVALGAALSWRRGARWSSQWEKIQGVSK